MADIELKASSILDGGTIDIGSNRIAERTDLSLVSVATPLGGEDALNSALKKAFGLDMPKPGMRVEASSAHAVYAAPDQLMLILDHATPDAAAVVRSKLGSTGYVTDQTDAWVILEVSGPETERALERICPIDIHPDVFPFGAAARTVMEHMGAVITRMEDTRFLLLSARSSARSFLHAVETCFRYVSDDGTGIGHPK